jgi:hypothetical protein
LFPYLWSFLLVPLVEVISHHLEFWLVKLKVKEGFLGYLNNLLFYFLYYFLYNFLYDLFLFGLKHVHVHWKIEFRE